MPEDRVVRGEWRVEYLVLDPDDMLIPVAVKTAGFIQDVQRFHRGYIITVTSNIESIAVKSRSTPDPSGLPDLFRDPHLLENLSKSGNDSDTVRIAMDWVDRKIQYADGPDDSQDIDSVAERGYGNCVGRSEVMSSLLNGLGITTRTVSGCLYHNGDTRFHRWIEVDYPDIGSLQTETGITQDYITPYHIILLPSASVDPSTNRLSELGVQITIRSEIQKTWTIDLWPAPSIDSSIVSRRQTSFQRSVAAIVGQMEPIPDPDTYIDLRTNTGTISRLLSPQGCFSFLPVSPGTYELLVRGAGRLLYKRTDILKQGDLIHLQCDLKNRGSVRE